MKTASLQLLSLVLIFLQNLETLAAVKFRRKTACAKDGRNTSWLQDARQCEASETMKP